MRGRKGRVRNHSLNLGVLKWPAASLGCPWLPFGFLSPSALPSSRSTQKHCSDRRCSILCPRRSREPPLHTSNTSTVTHKAQTIWTSLLIFHSAFDLRNDGKSCVMAGKARRKKSIGLCHTGPDRHQRTEPACCCTVNDNLKEHRK